MDKKCEKGIFLENYFEDINSKHIAGIAIDL